MRFHKIGDKILELGHIESVEPFDEYKTPDIKIIMSSSKKHYISYESTEKRDDALEKLWNVLAGIV